MVTIDGWNISMTRGDSQTFTFKPMIAQEGVPEEEWEEYELQPGDTITMNVRNGSKVSGEVVLQKTSSTHSITLTPEDTKDLVFKTYYYDVQLTKADGWVDTFIGADVSGVLPQFTIRWEGDN